MIPLDLQLYLTAADAPEAPEQPEETPPAQEAPPETGTTAPEEGGQQDAAGQETEETGQETEETGAAAGGGEDAPPPEEVTPPAGEPEAPAEAVREDGRAPVREEPGETDREEVPVQETPLPQEPASPQEEDGTETRSDQQLTQMTVVPDGEDGGGTPLLFPFLGGLFTALAALLAAALWLRRRRSRRPAAVPAGPVRWASVHQLGDREDQQDAFCLAGTEAPETGLFAAVADGMGGLVNSGQLSAALAETLRESYAPDDSLAPSRQLQLLFSRGLAQAEALTRASTAQSGTTLVSCLVKDGGLSWLSVGDSRIYLWRGGGLIQLNRDHDFHHDLTLLALQGDMELEEADRDPRRENLTSFIGRGFPRKVEWNQEPVSLLPGDRVLLVSDGVYRALSPEEMARCLEGGAKAAARAIRKAVADKALPQQDNYTAVILALS